MDNTGLDSNRAVTVAGEAQMSTNDSKIELDLERGRFTLAVDGGVAELGFTRSDQRVMLNHVRVPEAAGGKGIAGLLTRHALDWVRNQGARAVPICPYVRSWIDRHPDYQDLVAR